MAFPGAGLLSTAPHWEAGQEPCCDHTHAVGWTRRLCREPGAHWACQCRLKQYLLPTGGTGGGSCPLHRGYQPLSPLWLLFLLVLCKDWSGAEHLWRCLRLILALWPSNTCLRFISVYCGPFLLKGDSDLDFFFCLWGGRVGFFLPPSSPYRLCRKGTGGTPFKDASASSFAVIAGTTVPLAPS